MSFQAMSWAVEQSTANSGQKLVLLMLADYSNSETGQCNPSHQRLADKCCMGVTTLKRHIDDLADAGLLTKVPVFADSVQRPNQYVLHIPGSPNWTHPQAKLDPPPAQNGLQNLEVKPINKPSIDSDLFEQFWKSYPRKTNKGFARKVFSKLKVNQELLNTMLKALAVQVPQWKDPQYIPHPSTWLNGERWLDEPQFKTVYNNHGEI